VLHCATVCFVLHCTALCNCADIAVQHDTTVLLLYNTALCHCAVVQKISEKPQVVNEYESGKAIPNQAVISKLERALGINSLLFSS